MKADKITVVGAGAIGATVSYLLVNKELASEVVIINRNEVKAQTKAFDISHCTPMTGGIKIYQGSYEDSAGSDIVLVTAGALPDKNGTRMDVLVSNIEILKNTIPQIVKYSPRAVIVIVTNPVDSLSYVVQKISGLPASQVIGTGTLLDSLRFRTFLGQELQINPSFIKAEVLGEHGDSMVPIWSRVTVASLPLNKYLQQNGFLLDQAGQARILENTRRAGWNIRLGNEHSCYGVSFSMVKIVETILEISPEVIPVSTFLNGEYGIKNVFMSVPCSLNKQGIESIRIIDLDADETEKLAASADIIRRYLEEIDKFF